MLLKTIINALSSNVVLKKLLDLNQMQYAMAPIHLKAC